MTSTSFILLLRPRIMVALLVTIFLVFELWSVWNLAEKVPSKMRMDVEADANRLLKAEAERQAELQRQREAAETERQAKLKRQRESAEAERQAELKRQREAEAERQAELKRQRQAAETEHQAELNAAAEAEIKARRQQGLLDRTAWEDGLKGQSDAFKEGVNYWAAHRNVRPRLGPRTCERHGKGNVDFTSGCETARRSLREYDRRRKADKWYKDGWNDYQ